MEDQKNIEEKTDLNKMLELLRGVVDEMEDSTRKRQAFRALKTITGDHHSCAWLTKILERKSEIKEPIITEARRVFEDILQFAIDCLFDVTSESHEGLVPYAKLTLLYFCVDELLVAAHLTQHAFVNQAYTHLRSVYEALDKAELFEKQPEFVKLWASNAPEDKKTQIKELSPAAVRKKLGKERYDPIYSFFSEFGPHGTFRMAQSRSGIQKNGGKRPKLHIWIGGCPFESNVFLSASFLIWVSTQYACKVAELFGSKIDDREMIPRLYKISNECFEFLNTYYVPWIEKEGIDPKPLKDHIEKWLMTIKTLNDFESNKSP